MTIEDAKTNIQEVIHEYQKADVCNFYYDIIQNLKWVLKMLEEVDEL